MTGQNEKPGFLTKYMNKPMQEPECYDCEHCRRDRYLKGEWFCRIKKPWEDHTGCFVRRGNWPRCFECVNWELTDPRCMEERSQWAGCTTSPDNYCRYFRRNQSD